MTDRIPPTDSPELAPPIATVPPLAPMPELWVDGYTFDCTRETMVVVGTSGLLEHWPAYPYEVNNFCGHPPTIDHFTNWDGNVLFVTNPDGSPVGEETIGFPDPLPLEGARELAATGGDDWLQWVAAAIILIIAGVALWIGDRK